MGEKCDIHGGRSLAACDHGAAAAFTSKPSTTELAALIAASPRFRGDTGRYFDEIAAKHGPDIAGVAWAQACLKVDLEDRWPRYTESA